MLTILLFQQNRSQYAPGAILSRMRSAQECEPFSSFGTLMVDSHDADKNQWVPFDPTCTPPAFMAQLRGERPIRSMSKSSQASTDAFAWLRHKTALIIGDAVSREHVENFCQLLGEESVAIRPGHKYAPQDTPARAASKASHHVDKPNRLDGRASRLMRDTGRPRLCYIPKHDFMVSLQSVEMTDGTRAEPRFDSSSCPFCTLAWTRKISGATRTCRSTLLLARSSTG